jgi:hypothetical protein
VVFINYGILFSHKKNEILSFASKWVDLENIILSEVSQVEKVKGIMFQQYFEKHIMPREVTYKR